MAAASTSPVEQQRDALVQRLFESNLARPIEALRSVRAMLKEGGTVLMPTGMAEQPSAGTGAVMRLATLRDDARRAGFRDVEVLPIDDDFWRFYRLVA